MRTILLIPLLVTLAAAAYLGWLFYAIQHQATLHEERPAPAVVVFGAAEYRGRPSAVLRGRLDQALLLYRRHFAPRIITTGGSGGEAGFTEAGVAERYLLAHGVPAADIIIEPAGTSTEDSVQRVATLLHLLQAREVLVVSDGYHIYRIKKMFAARGITAYGAPRPPGPASNRLQRGWLTLRQTLGYTLWQLGFPE